MPFSPVGCDTPAPLLLLITLKEMFDLYWPRVIIPADEIVEETPPEVDDLIACYRRVTTMSLS